MTTVEHLYVHAPFCARRCPYCDFAVKVRRTGGHEAWLAAIRAELGIREASGEVRLASPLRTVFVGGGTPSLLGEGAMSALRGVLTDERVSGPDLEWTVEANPESFTAAVARDWREAGVSRVSIGVQSFDDGVLRWMGRLHGADGAREAVARARAAGLGDVSLDLIFGLPGHLERDLAKDLDLALSLGPTHLSLYGLSAEPGTPLHRWIEGGREQPLDEERYADEYLAIADRLRREGFHHYEVSNFARPGFESVHNRAYWAGIPYLGIGNGSHSFIPPVRSWNLRGWDEYSTRVAAGGDPTDGGETVDGEAEELESVWLSLRTDRGLAVPSGCERAGALAREWVERGLASLTDGQVVLSPAGWLILDELAVEMTRVLASGAHDTG